MNNLRKFTTEAEYTAATLNYPSVSWVTSTDAVHFDKESPVPPTPATFSGLTVYYNITDISSPTQLFKGASGSGSGSGSGGVLPSSMIIDGTEIEVTNAYQFSTTGEHIVNYSFADNQIPTQFLTSANETVRKAEIGDAITRINDNAFNNCLNITAVTLGNSLTYIGNDAFNSCSGLQSIVSNAMTAPTLGVNVFSGIGYNGVLTVPSGSQGYCDWITSGYLPSYWTIQGVTCGGGSGSGSGSGS